jgi:ribonuclease HI
MANYKLQADGGSRGNPGPAACGFVIYRDGEIVEREGKFLNSTTNNVAEWTGLIEGLKKMKTLLEAEKQKSLNTITFEMDSMLVVMQIQRKWKVKQEHLKPLYEEGNLLVKEVEKLSGCPVIFSHIYREFNKQADAVVNEILNIQP